MDSCIFIYLVEAKPPLAQLVAEALSSPQLQPCASGVVRMECLVGPLKRMDNDQAAIYRNFLDTVETLSIPHTAWELAAALRAEHGLLLPDALHLAIAEVNGCDEFWTADTHFERMSGLLNTSIRMIA